MSHQTPIEQMRAAHEKLQKKQERNKQLLSGVAEVFRVTLASVLGVNDDQIAIETSDKGWLLTLSDEGIPEPIRLPLELKPREEGGLYASVDGYVSRESVVLTDTLTPHLQSVEYLVNKVVDKLREQFEKKAAKELSVRR